MTNYIDWWTFVIKNLAQLNYLPDTLRNRIFEKLFFEAEIAKLSKVKRREYNQSLKKLNDMNLIIRDRDRQIEDRDIIIAERDGEIAVLTKDNAAKDKRIAELERKLGLNGASSKPTPPGKVRTRNSAKARATAN